MERLSGQPLVMNLFLSYSTKFDGVFYFFGSRPVTFILRLFLVIINSIPYLARVAPIMDHWLEFRILSPCSSDSLYMY